MRKNVVIFLLPFLLITVLIMEFQTKAHAAILAPPITDIGSLLNVTITEIPKTPNQYCTTVRQLINGQSGPVVDQFKFTVTGEGQCIPVSTPLQPKFFIKPCLDMGPFFNLEATAQTNQLGISADTSLLLDVNSGTLCNQDFAITATNIDAFPDRSNATFAMDAEPDPANPNAATVTLFNVTPGTFNVGVVNETFVRNECVSETCKIAMQLLEPMTMNTPIVVQEEATGTQLVENPQVQTQTPVQIKPPVQPSPAQPPPGIPPQNPAGPPPPPPIAAGCGPEQVATIECLQEKINNSLTWAFALAGIVGLIFVIYAGIKFVTSGGESQPAQNILKFVGIGAVLLAFSYVILWLISRITGAPIL